MEAEAVEEKRLANDWAEFHGLTRINCITRDCAIRDAEGGASRGRALVIAHLTGSLRQQALTASHNEVRTTALFGMARKLAGAADAMQVSVIARDFVSQATDGRAVIFVRGVDGQPHAVAGEGSPAATRSDAPIVDLVMSGGEYVELDFNAYVPLVTSSGVHGALAVSFDVANAADMHEPRELLIAVALLIAIVIDRIQLAAAQGRREILE